MTQLTFFLAHRNGTILILSKNLRLHYKYRALLLCDTAIYRTKESQYSVEFHYRRCRIHNLEATNQDILTSAASIETIFIDGSAVIHPAAGLTFRRLTDSKLMT